jgi:hypothetical protein
MNTLCVHRLPDSGACGHVEEEWEDFLQGQSWSPFLQSIPMGEVYRAVGQEPVRLIVRSCARGAACPDEASSRQASGEHEEIVGICQAIVVSAKRGKYLSVPYGPVLGAVSDKRLVVSLFVEELKKVAMEQNCSFLRMSPFWPRSGHSAIRGCEEPSGSRRERVSESEGGLILQVLGFRPSPLHMLAEHIWYIDLERHAPNDAEPCAKGRAGGGNSRGFERFCA